MVTSVAAVVTYSAAGLLASWPPLVAGLDGYSADAACVFLEDFSGIRGISNSATYIPPSVTIEDVCIGYPFALRALMSLMISLRPTLKCSASLELVAPPGFDTICRMRLCLYPAVCSFVNPMAYPLKRSARAALSSLASSILSVIPLVRLS